MLWARNISNKKKPDIENAIKIAYDTDYRLFDTAELYENEDLIGDALKELKIPRNEIFITTKIIPTSNTYEKAKKSIEASFKNCKLTTLTWF